MYRPGLKGLSQDWPSHRSHGLTNAAIREAKLGVEGIVAFVVDARLNDFIPDWREDPKDFSPAVPDFDRLCHFSASVKDMIYPLGLET